MTNNIIPSINSSVFFRLPTLSLWKCQMYFVKPFSVTTFSSLKMHLEPRRIDNCHFFASQTLLQQFAWLHSSSSPDDSFQCVQLWQGLPKRAFTFFTQLFEGFWLPHRHTQRLQVQGRNPPGSVGGHHSFVF